LLLRNTEVVGAGWGGYVMGRPDLNREIGEAIGALVADGVVRPLVGARFPLARGADAMRLIDERRATGKVVLDVPGE
jgi:NADPH:quinone reductase